MIRKKYTKREITIGLFGTVFAILVFTFYIWHQMESVRLGYEVQRLEQKLDSLREEVKHLEATKSSLLSLERVEKIAREELKLTEPKREQLIYEESIRLP